MPISLTRRSVTLSAGAATQIAAASPTRRYFMVVNVEPVRAFLGPANDVTAANGLPLEPAASSGAQGGALELIDPVAPDTAMFAFAASAGRVVVLEG